MLETGSPRRVRSLGQDPWTTAIPWKDLNEWDMLERHLVSSTTAADRTGIVAAATAAVGAFIMVHATLPAAEGMAL